MFNCIFKTYIFNFNFIIKFFMCKLTIMLNLCNLCINYINLYFFKVNVILQVQAYFKQILYT